MLFFFFEADSSRGNTAATYGTCGLNGAIWRQQMKSFLGLEMLMASVHHRNFLLTFWNSLHMNQGWSQANKLICASWLLKTHKPYFLRYTDVPLHACQCWGWHLNSVIVNSVPNASDGNRDGDFVSMQSISICVSSNMFLYTQYVLVWMPEEQIGDV